jgi:membrane associated rhomboid family serine protease
MLFYKLALVTLVCLIAQVIALKRLETARWLLRFGTVVTALVVIYGVSLFVRRAKDREVERPFRVPFVPIFPIIGACLVSFLLQLVPGLGWTERWLFWPAGGAVEPWRFLTVAFLHSTGMLLHIAFNMYALYITGQFLEPLLGRVRFAALCALSAVGGSVGFLLFGGVPGPLGVGWMQGTVGASGMVFGLFGAMLPVLRRLGRSAGQIVVLLVINGVLGFVVPGIAWQAHLGGLVTGLAIGAAFAFAPRRSQRAIGVVAPAGMLLILVLAAVAKYEFAVSAVLLPGQV